MGLQRYHEKRDFTVTPEPKGGAPSKTGFSYVIQKHAASHLHYDFRLELDGVLLSWAVPKGPSLNPGDRRLAMQTEDHPIEYGGFEGTIPQGEYGGGTVMVWDRGTWEPLEDPRKAYAKGHLRFVLHGEKLRGGWHLVRTGKASDEKKGWLLFKSRDAEARTDGPSVLDLDNSAKTGRTMEQIAGAGDKVWHSNRAAKNAGHGGTRQKESSDGTSKKNAPSAPRRKEELEALLEKAKPGRLPGKLELQRPTLVKKVPTGPKWAHELKYDGARILARLESGSVKLLNSDGQDWTGTVPSLAALISGLPFSTALFDGEIAVARPDGTTDFRLLEDALDEGTGGEITFFVFDLLHLNGRDLRALPLGQRKAILEIALAESSDPRLHFSRHLVSSGDDFFQAACKVGARGIISKKLDQPYRSGKGRDWVLTECVGPKASGKARKGDAHERREKVAHQRNANAAAPPASAKSVTAGLRFTHPDRVLYPRDGITKQELAEYYAAVNPWMMPHVANRPLTLVRCPQGIGKQKFFQKNAKPPLPKSIRAIPIADEGETLQYMAIDDQAGLISLAQMSVVEIHTWGAHADDPEKPDFLVFDLDPDPAVKWPDVIACAELMKKGLLELGLESYVKTTGGKGLHVCVPIARRVSWDEAKEFCRGLTELMVRLNPQAYVATMSKSQRTGKIFIDFFRNGRGATFIAPYSTRARDGAPVAMPLAWDELSTKIGADHFHVRNVMKRMARLSQDPWKDASSKKQVLSAAAIRAVLHPPKVAAAGAPR
jgi:bifunctional non-homologous end joining protein LigD